MIFGAILMNANTCFINEGTTDHQFSPIYGLKATILQMSSTTVEKVSP